MQKFFKFKNSTLWCIAILSLAVPLFLLDNRYFQDIAILTFLWAGLASSWNLNSGYSGRLSIGHAAYMGIGAYTTTLLYLNFGISPWIGIFAGSILSAIAALIIGGTTLRLKGTYFVLCTIAFAEIIKTVAITWKDVTAGSMGLMIPYEPAVQNMIFEAKEPYAIIAWGYMLSVIGLCVWLEKSKLGYSLIAVGENQEAAENLGVNSTKTMLVAFVGSAMLTSIGGGLFAFYISFIEPVSLMNITYSVNFLLYAIAGGMGMAFGPMIGAFILVPTTNLLRGYLASISGLHGVLLGLILILVLLYKPNGLLPMFIGFAEKIKKVFTKNKEKKEAVDASRKEE